MLQVSLEMVNRSNPIMGKTTVRNRNSRTIDEELVGAKKVSEMDRLSNLKRHREWSPKRKGGSKSEQGNISRQRGRQRSKIDDKQKLTTQEESSSDPKRDKRDPVESESN